MIDAFSSQKNGLLDLKLKAFEYAKSSSSVFAKVLNGASDAVDFPP